MRRFFYVEKRGAVWAVKLDEQVISTHATYGGAVTSCNQLNRAEGWDV